MAEEPQTPPSLEEFRAAQAAQAKKATPPSLEEFRAAQAAQNGQQPPFVQAPSQQQPPQGGSVGAPAGASPSTSAAGGGGAIAAPPVTSYSLPTEEELQAAPRPTIDQLRKEGLELQARSIEQQRERSKVDLASRFADLDLAGVKKVRGDIEQRKEQIADLRTRMEAQRKAIEAAAPTSPEGADMALSEINSYNARITALDDLAYSVQRDEELANQREFNLKAKQGTIPGWLHNEFIQGIGSMAAGTEGFMIEAMARGLPSSLLPASEEEKATMTRDQLAKKWKREILPAMREMPEKAWGSETTPEYMQAARGTWIGSAAGGVTQSIPMMLTPAMSGFFVSGVDGYMRELEGPKFDDIPEAEKLAVAVPGAYVANILERYGFRNLVANKSALYEVTRVVLNRVPENATIEQATKIINAETPSAAKNYLSRSVGGFMSEAETGGMQEIADVSIRNLYNTIKEKKVFKEPTSWYEFASDVTRSAIEEGIGGKIMAQVPAVSAAMRTSSLGENSDDKHFELVERLLLDKSYEEAMWKHIDSKVEAGDISLEDAERMKADWKAAQNISSRIPEDLSTSRRRRVFDILTEKEKLSRMEPVLVREKIEQLDTKLAQAAGVGVTEEKGGSATQSTKAIPDTPAPTMEWEGEAVQPKQVGQPQVVDEAKQEPVQQTAEQQAVLQPDERTVVAEAQTSAAPAAEEGVAPPMDIAPEAIAEIDDVLGITTAAPAAQPEGPVRPEGTGAIPVSERRSKTEPGGKRPMVYVENVRKALSEVAPGIKVFVHATPDAYRAAIEGYNAQHGTKADPAQSTAIYLPASEEVHLSPSADGQSLAHEAAHPIVSALITHRPEVFERLYDEIASDPAMAKMLEFGKLYSDQDPIVQKAESIVRLMDAVAAGEIRVSTDPKSAWQRFKRWLQDLLASIGFDTRSIDLSDPKNVREFAASFSDAIANGIGIKKVQGDGARSSTPEMQRRDPAEVAAVFAKHGMTADAAHAYMQQKGIDPGFAQQVVDAMQQPAPAQQPKQPEKAEEKKPERAKRKTTKRLVASRPELEKVVTDEMVYYERLPNDVTEAEALSVIEADGVHGAAAAVLDRSNPMSLPVRVVVGGVVLNRLREEKRYDEMIEFGEEYVAMMTELGQGVQAIQRVYGRYWDANIAVRTAQKAVAKDREKRKRAAKKTIDRLKKGLEQENAEAAEEVAKTASVRKKTSTASSAPTKTFASEVREAVETAKNKTVTAKAAKAAFDAMRGKLYSSVSPEMVVIATYYIERGARTFAEVAKVVAKRLGNKALPYLKGAYIEANKQLGLDDSDVSSDAEIDEYIFKANTDKAVEKLRKAIERKNKKEADAAIAELQQVSKDYGLWGQYREYAIDRLKRMQLQEIKQDIEADPPLREFTDSLVRNLSAQAREAAEEAGLEKPEPKKRRDDIEVIADAFKNFERYKEVWEATRREMQAPYFAAMARAEKAETPEARAEAHDAIQRERAKLERLDNYFGEVGPKPFAESIMAKAVKDGMKALDQKIEDIIKQHYTEYDSAKRSLQQKLVELAGLDGKEAEELASAVGAEFDRIATEKKRRFIRSVLPATDKVARKRKVKAVEDELVALTNAGAFSDDDFIKAYGEKMGWPKLTRENIQEIERLAERVQTSPEGRPRVEAIQDLLGYQQSIPGIDAMEIAQSVWYANMLSGFETQEVNVLANFANMLLEASIATGRMASSKEQRKYLAGLWTSMAEGMATGKLEASAVWRTGYDPIRGQIQVPSTLERHTFKGGAKNPANYLKYVRRFMVASDAIFFEGNRSLRAYQLAVRMASADKKLDPSIDVRNRAAELLGQGSAELEQAKMQAQREYDDEVSAINNSSLGAREKQKALKKAELDRKRRVFELTEKKRPEPIAVGAAQFARRATYNYKPEGTIGAIANFINLGLQSLPAFRYVVPFTNVIANVANETLNYTPVGYIRAARDGRVFVRRDEFTPDQKADAIWKASIGMATMAALYLLSHPTDDDDDPVIEITANGFGDYRKNEVLREKGWKPYSFRIGKGPYISYQYTPLILAMGFIGNLNDYVRYRKKKVADTTLGKWTKSLGYTSLAFMDMTFLSSMNNVLSAAMDPRNEDWVDDLTRGMAKTARSFVVPNLYTQGAKMVMDLAEIPQKETRGTLMGNLLKDIPVFRAQYQDAVNVLGDPVIPEWGRLASMSSDDPVANFLGDKGISIVAPHPNTLTYTDANGDERMYTDEQKHEFYVRRGQYIRQRIEAEMSGLKDMDKKRLEKKVASITAQATKRAKMGLLGIQ